MATSLRPMRYSSTREGAEAEVAGEEEDDAAGDGVAVDHGDGGFGEGEELEVGVAVEAEEAAGAELLGEAGGAEVEAAAEEAPGAGDDDGADAVLPGGGVEGGREVGEEVAVDGVGGRPVQGEEPDAALAGSSARTVVIAWGL